MRKLYLLLALLMGISSATHATDFTPDPSKVYIIKNVGNSYIPMFCVTNLKYSGDGAQKYVLGARVNKFDSRSFFVIEGNSTDGYTIRLREVTDPDTHTATTERYTSLASNATVSKDHTIRTKIVSNTSELTDREKWNITETTDGSGKYIISSKALEGDHSWNIRGSEYTESGISDKVKGVGTWDTNTSTSNQWYIYSLDELENGITNTYGTIAEENDNKVGYPTAEYCQQLRAVHSNYNTLSSAWDVSTANAFSSAYITVTSSIPLNMPVSGKAYKIKNIAFGTTAQWYFKYASSGITTTSDVNEATPFVCREVSDGVYAFVCNDGKYLTWKGINTTDYYRGPNANKGFVDVFDYAETSGSTSYTDWTQLTVAKLNPGTYVTGTYKDLWGYLTLKGRRYNNAATNYYVLKSDGVFDGASAPFFKNNNGTNYSSAFMLEEVSYANVVTPKDFDETRKIATFSAPFPTVVPENTTAYSVAAQTDADVTSVTTYTVAEAGDAIPANTGVILLSTNSSLTMLPRTTETVVTVEDGALKNSAGAAKDITTENSYVLSNKSGWAFYKVGSSATNLPMNKAYLVLPEGGSGASIRLNFGEATAVDNIVTDNAASTSKIYDLTGREVKAATKGIYIINGKKVIVK
ncbi:MAG: hypothetical protein ACI3YC_01360 [Alloprevotella sp.]